MNKELKQLIKSLRIIHGEKTSEPTTIGDKLDYNSYLLDQHTLSRMKEDWLEIINKNPERIFNMPTNMFKLYDFTATIFENANRVYTKKMDETSKTKSDKKMLVENFQSKMVEKARKEYLKIENEKREEKASTIIKFIEDINRAAKRR